MSYFARDKPSLPLNMISTVYPQSNQAFEKDSEQIRGRAPSKADVRAVVDPGDEDAQGLWPESKTAGRGHRSDGDPAYPFQATGLSPACACDRSGRGCQPAEKTMAQCQGAISVQPESLGKGVSGAPVGRDQGRGTGPAGQSAPPVGGRLQAGRKRPAGLEVSVALSVSRCHR